MMFAGKNQTFLRFSPGHHAYEYYKRAEFRGEKKLEIAVAISTDPVIFLVTSLELSTSSQSLARCGVNLWNWCDARRSTWKFQRQRRLSSRATCPFPRRLETKVRMANFYGYSVGKMERERLWNIECITMRKKILYHGFYLAKD